MNSAALVITSIAPATHPILKLYATQAQEQGLSFIVVGDRKSPATFDLPGCDFYSLSHQEGLRYALAKKLPQGHYARKNLGYLIAIEQGAEVILETDDDNIPLPDFWETRQRVHEAASIAHAGWINVYKYFTEAHIWPRGFALEALHNALPSLGPTSPQPCPIQQGLADDNPDVDAVYRLTLPLPVVFTPSQSVALQVGSICPFNSQNTTWFREAFPLLYLPSFCSFRMTDIWRSFIAQRIAWTCGWSLLFHSSTVRQERNAHRLLQDFQDEIPGYLHNAAIVDLLHGLELKEGREQISTNLRHCYQSLVEHQFLECRELELVEAWLEDLALFMP